MKVIFQRAEAKDYRDIAALLASGLTLAYGLGCAVALYGPDFNAALPLKALCYFEDGDLPALDPAVKNALIVAAREVREIPRVPRARERISSG
ncbi:MAG: hypothetical protein M3463_01215 [Verrucomicrobiota bacterium]|nr:hypothetical protein [Verrucomicrobiota bacterium]